LSRGRKLSPALVRKLRRIRIIILDVDGVLTDGSIIYGADGMEYKRFHVHDGYGIFRGREKGLKFAIISGRTSRVTAFRARRLKITDVHQGSEDKVAAFRKIIKKYRLTPDEVCFVGDDEFDLSLLRLVGVSAAPADAMGRVKREVDCILSKRGGRGAVREIIDMILTAKKLL
jgi:3-deoxy-D-manno-octulosonate 8-phosphate phosphatase (KDO 8-P phosphatase)